MPAVLPPITGRRQAAPVVSSPPGAGAAPGAGERFALLEDLSPALVAEGIDQCRLTRHRGRWLSQCQFIQLCNLVRRGIVGKLVREAKAVLRNSGGADSLVQRILGLVLEAALKCRVDKARPPRLLQVFGCARRDVSTA